MNCCSNFKAFVPQIAVAVGVFALVMLFTEGPVEMVFGVLAVAAAGFVAYLQLGSGAPAKKETEPPKAEQPSKPAAVDASGSAEAEVIAFLALLQDKGRLIDFLMDDIAQVDDAQVGTAARVVYQGCRSALLEHLKIEPLSGDAEGSKVTVPKGYKVSEFKLTGSLSGEAPFEGTLVHKGWKVTSIKLPKVIVEKDELPPLAPAQVEV